MHRICSYLIINDVSLNELKTLNLSSRSTFIYHAIEYWEHMTLCRKCQQSVQFVRWSHKTNVKRIFIQPTSKWQLFIFHFHKIELRVVQINAINCWLITFPWCVFFMSHGNLKLYHHNETKYDLCCGEQTKITKFHL